VVLSSPQHLYWYFFQHLIPWLGPIEERFLFAIIRFAADDPGCWARPVSSGERPHAGSHLVEITP
jgi:hypothetical protein